MFVLVNDVSTFTMLREKNSGVHPNSGRVWAAREKELRENGRESHPSNSKMEQVGNMLDKSINSLMTRVEAVESSQAHFQRAMAKQQEHMSGQLSELTELLRQSRVLSGEPKANEGKRASPEI